MTQAQIQSVMESTSYDKIPASVKSTLGSELITNGDFNGNITGWGKSQISNTPTLSYNNGKARIVYSSSGNFINIGINTTTNPFNGVTGTVKVTGNINIVSGSLNGNINVYETNTANIVPITLDSNGNFIAYIKVGSNQQLGIYSNSDDIILEFDNISAKLVSNDLVAYYGLDSTVSTEKITNGDFSAWTNDNPDGWTISTDLSGGVESDDVKITEDANGARIYSTGTNIHMTQNVMTIGATYEVTIVVHSVTTGDITTQNLSSNLSINSAGTHTVTTTATATGFRIKRNFPVDMVISSVSVKEVQTPDSLGNNNGVLL